MWPIFLVVGIFLLVALPYIGEVAAVVLVFFASPLLAMFLPAAEGLAAGLGYPSKGPQALAVVAVPLWVAISGGVAIEAWRKRGNRRQTDSLVNLLILLVGLGPCLALAFWRVEHMRWG